MADDPASAKAGGTADRPSKGSGDPEPPYHGFLSGLPAKPALEMALELAHGAAFWFNEAGQPQLAEEIHRIMRGVAEPARGRGRPSQWSEADRFLLAKHVIEALYRNPRLSERSLMARLVQREPYRSRLAGSSDAAVALRDQWRRFCRDIMEKEPADTLAILKQKILEEKAGDISTKSSVVE